MPTVKTGKDKELPFRVPNKGVVGWRKLYEILGFILGKMGFKLSFDGIDAQEIEGGIHISAITPDDGANDFPFKVTASGGGYIVSSGTYNGVIPTGLTGAIGAYIYLHVHYTHSATSGGYVYASTLNSAAIVSSSSPTTDPLGPNSGDYYILLATFSGGTKTGQYIQTSLVGEVCDSGGADSTANLSTQRT